MFPFKKANIITKKASIKGLLENRQRSHTTRSSFQEVQNQVVRSFVLSTPQCMQGERFCSYISRWASFRHKLWFSLGAMISEFLFIGFTIRSDKWNEDSSWKFRYQHDWAKYCAPNGLPWEGNTNSLFDFNIFVSSQQTAWGNTCSFPNFQLISMLIIEFCIVLSLSFCLAFLSQMNISSFLKCCILRLIFQVPFWIMI